MTRLFNLERYTRDRRGMALEEAADIDDVGSQGHIEIIRRLYWLRNRWIRFCGGCARYFEIKVGVEETELMRPLLPRAHFKPVTGAGSSEREQA